VVLGTDWYWQTALSTSTVGCPSGAGKRRAGFVDDPLRYDETHDPDTDQHPCRGAHG
jgi:hypothetical protein